MDHNNIEQINHQLTYTWIHESNGSNIKSSKSSSDISTSSSEFSMKEDVSQIGDIAVTEQSTENSPIYMSLDCDKSSSFNGKKFKDSIFVP